jgi:transposase-like protein
MPSRSTEWTFTESQRAAVCKGELCPRCASKNVDCIGAVPDGINLNAAYHCQNCDETWEGY